MHLLNHFECRSRADNITALALLEESDKWSARFFATPYDANKYVSLRKQVEAAYPTI
jgi:hypothetical protein